MTPQDTPYLRQMPFKGTPKLETLSTRNTDFFPRDLCCIVCAELQMILHSESTYEMLERYSICNKKDNTFFFFNSYQLRIGDVVSILKCRC